MKHLVIFLSVIFLSTNLFAQGTGVLYLYKTSKGLVWKNIGNDKIQAKYNGAIQNGKPEGIGNLTSPNGDKYDGLWSDGKKHGQGTYTFSSGAKYEGIWKEGKKHSHGTFSWSNGNKYVGEWNVGKIHGQGTYSYSNGNKYAGKWEEGKKHGKGTYTYASGSIYEGEFKYGPMNGQGKFTWYNGTKRVGEFRKGKLWNITEYGKKGDILRKWVNGVKVVDKRKEQFLYLRKDNGKWLWSEKGNEKNDGIYFGIINEKGLPSEAGIITFPNGDKYEGELNSGIIHGQGTFSWSDGNIYIG